MTNTRHEENLLVVFTVEEYATTIREQSLQWGYNMFNRFGGEGIFLYEFDFLPSTF
jgi:hypothetical protein